MPEQLATARAGLFAASENARIPLRGVRVDADISGLCARVTIAQRFTNAETQPIEAVYVFPLDEGAAVCGFEAEIDGTRVVGEVMEREKAFDMYDDALEKGHGGFLLDEERPDVFQASIGNLLPGKDVLVKITYVVELAVARGTGLRFTIPTTVAPRYAPSEDKIGVGRSDADALNPPTTFRVPYGLELEVNISMPGAISRIESPSHPLNVSMTGNDAVVRLSQRESALDRDFVLSVETHALDTPQAVVERAEDGTAAAAVCFVPTFDVARVPADIVFVIDRSGSMGGSSIHEVRNALQLCLRSLLPGCRFNIVGFGSTFQVLFDESRAYDEQTLQEASAHVATLDADLGGTELLPALDFVLGQPRGTLPRQVVVLTDGEVTNTDAVLALARKHAAGARIFTFGIGAGASHHLVKGLARAGGGTAEFIYPGERIEPKVMRQFARLLSPALTDVKVEWGGLAVRQAPVALPPIWDGERFVVYGFVSEPRPAMIRLSAESARGPVSFDVPFDPSTPAHGSAVATLGARARVRELEESPAWIEARGSRQRRPKPSDASREIIELCIRYGLVSRETSFVAVERRDTPVTGDMQLRKVPIALTTGWGGFDMLAGGIHAGTLAMGLPVPPPHASSRLTSPASDYMCGTHFEADASMVLRRSVEQPSRVGVRAGASPIAAPAFQGLVVLQRADGSWDLDSRLADSLGCELKELRASLAGATGDAKEASRALATALALEWLRRHAASDEEQWRLLAAKAEQWLMSVSAAPATGTWQERAAALL